MKSLNINIFYIIILFFGLMFSFNSFGVKKTFRYVCEPIYLQVLHNNHDVNSSKAIDLYISAVIMLCKNKSIPKAIKLLKQASSLNHINATFLLGKYYETSNILSDNKQIPLVTHYYEKTIDLLESTAGDYYVIGGVFGDFINVEELTNNCKYLNFSHKLSYYMDCKE